MFYQYYIIFIQMVLALLSSYGVFYRIKLAE